MKKTFNLLFLMTFLVLSISLISACTTNCPKEVTEVKGIVYQNNNLSDVVFKANVEVTCNHAYMCGGKIKYKEYNESTKSHKDGSYSVRFSPYECDQNDSVVVTAQKNELVGTEDGKITILTYNGNTKCLNKNVGIVNVPLVPEFGVFAGALTLLSAVGIFFFVRRK